MCGVGDLQPRLSGHSTLGAGVWGGVGDLQPRLSGHSTLGAGVCVG